MKGSFVGTIALLLLLGLMVVVATRAGNSDSNLSTSWDEIKKGSSINALLAPSIKAITESDLSKRLFGGKVYPVTLRYLDPFPKSTGCTGVHAGIDYGAPKDTDVRPATVGIVIKVADSVGGVFIFDGTNTIIYLHMTNIKVKPGDLVNIGAIVLGKVGSKGIATGPHLHLEVRKNYSTYATSCDAKKEEVQTKNLNPTSYIK